MTVKRGNTPVFCSVYTIRQKRYSEEINLQIRGKRSHKKSVIHLKINYFFLKDTTLHDIKRSSSPTKMTSIV